MVSKSRSQWFLTDLLRETANTVRIVTGFLLSPVCLIATIRRAKLAASILETFQILCSQTSLAQQFIPAIPTVVLMSRLREGPKPEWQFVDIKLKTMLSDQSFPLRPHTAVDFTLEVLGREIWGEVGETLRVCLW